MTMWAIAIKICYIIGAGGFCEDAKIATNFDPSPDHLACIMAATSVKEDLRAALADLDVTVVFGCIKVEQK